MCQAPTFLDKQTRKDQMLQFLQETLVAEGRNLLLTYVMKRQISH